MRPISNDMKMILAIHGHELSFEYSPKVEARPVYTCFDIHSGESIVHCAQPELAMAVIKFLKAYKWEIRDGAPIMLNNYNLKPLAPNPKVAGAEFSIRPGFWDKDENIAKTMLEAAYILGLDVVNK